MISSGVQLNCVFAGAKQNTLQLKRSYLLISLEALKDINVETPKLYQNTGLSKLFFIQIT